MVPVLWAWALPLLRLLQGAPAEVMVSPWRLALVLAIPTCHLQRASPSHVSLRQAGRGPVETLTGALGGSERSTVGTIGRSSRGVVGGIEMSAVWSMERSSVGVLGGALGAVRCFTEPGPG